MAKDKRKTSKLLVLESRLGGLLDYFIFQQIDIAEKGLGNNRKLTKEDVEYIRKNYTPRSKNNGMKALSYKFHVSTQTIKNIIACRCYKDYKN